MLIGPCRRKRLTGMTYPELPCPTELHIPSNLVDHLALGAKKCYRVNKYRII